MYTYVLVYKVYACEHMIVPHVGIEKFQTRLYVYRIDRYIYLSIYIYYAHMYIHIHIHIHTFSFIDLWVADLELGLPPAAGAVRPRPQGRSRAPEHVNFELPQDSMPRGGLRYGVPDIRNH